MGERSIRPVWIGAFLVGLGAAAIAWCPYELGVKIGEAVLVAGILSATVDLYLKRKLQEEAARDIFHYILGLKLPEELGNNLLAFAAENRVYRKDVVLGVDVQSTSQGVSITIETTAKVVAARKATYEQVLLFEESAQPTSVSASLTSSRNSSINYSRTDIQLKAKADEPMVLMWKGKTIRMQTAEELSFYSKYTVRGPTWGFYAVFFANPVIEPKVRLSGSEDLELSLSLADAVVGNEHIYRKVFLKGDHIQIRWKPRGMPV